MYTKLCVICGAEFQTKTWNKSVCYNDHYHPCPVCGKDVLCNDPRRQNSTCSRKCGQQLGNVSRAQSNLKKYGVDNVSKLIDVRHKISCRLAEIHPKQAIQYKQCEICGKLFELHWPYTQHTCSPECRGKYRTQSGIAKSAYQKSIVTNLERYGVANSGQRPEVHKKMEDTMEIRYGVRYARYIPEIEERVRKTCLERYGVPYYIQTEDANRNNIYRISKLNRNFSNMLSENGLHAEFEKFIQGKFYDLFISPNVLIELDPTYTHNSYSNHWNLSGLCSAYHVDKSKLAISNNYRCIHVFDWDDWDSIVKLLQPADHVLYARNCDVRLIDRCTADTFTRLYHIQGSCKGQDICYGLYHDNELVMVMTFGNPRYNKHYDKELLRLCTKSRTRVVGGASKLFKQFIQDNPDVSVISYCDASKFSGDVYEKIGMKFLRQTSPNKIWSKDNKKITQNLLNQRGYDQLFNTNYGKGTSNEQLMLDSGWLPVYDCGQYVYEYRV